MRRLTAVKLRLPAPPIANSTFRRSPPGRCRVPTEPRTTGLRAQAIDAVAYLDGRHTRRAVRLRVTADAGAGRHGHRRRARRRTRRAGRPGPWRTAATIIGTIVGAAIGGAVGRSMDEQDRIKTAHTLETVRTGVPSQWRNPDTGNVYTVTPTRTVETAQGPCREYSDRRVDRRQEGAGGRHRLPPAGRKLARGQPRPTHRRPA